MFETNNALTRDDLPRLASPGRNESFTVCRFDSRKASCEVSEFGQAIPRQSFSTFNDPEFMKTRLAQFSLGRVFLHLACLLRDHQLHWHCAGILRELHYQPISHQTVPPVNRNKLPSLQTLALVGLAMLLNVPASQAASHTWSGAVNGYWSVAGNWSAGGAPTNGESPLQLTFGPAASRINSTNDVTGLQVDTLTLNGFGYTIYGLPGKSLTLKGGTNIVCNDMNTIDSSLSMVLANTNYVSVVTNVQLTIQSPISGAGSLAKVGPGQLNLTGTAANSYGGATYALGGVLNLRRGASSNSPAIAVPGPLFVGSSTGGNVQVMEIFPQQLGSAPSVTVYSPAMLSLNAPQTVNSLTFYGGNIFGNSLLTLHGDISANLVTNSVTIGCPVSLGGATRTIHITGSYSYGITISGSINDGGSSAGLTKQGYGSLYLQASNSYSGPTIIAGGTIEIQNAWALGSINAGTVVSNGAVLRLWGNLSVGAKSLSLSGLGPFNSGCVYLDSGVCSWAGPVTLASDSRVQILDVSSKLNFTGPISGPGGLDKVGDGTVTFSGNSANLYVGNTTVSSGRLELNKAGVNAISGLLSIGDDITPTNNATVQLLHADQIADTSAVTVHKSGTLGFDPINAPTETIGSLAGSGSVNLVVTVMTTGGNNADTSFDGIISGLLSAQIVKNGSGIFTLNGTNTIFGSASVNAGKLVINGVLPGTLQMNSLSFLSGTGTVGNVTASLGHVAPGNSVGRITTGNLALINSGSSLDVQVNSATPGVGYDQILVNGSVSLANPALNVSLGFAGAVGAKYVLISNDGLDPVNGTFNGLPEGASFAAGNAQFQITYKGGDGNDVVLTQLSAVTAPQLGGITQSPNGQIQLTGTGVPGQTYIVQANSDLMTTNWVNIGSALADPSGNLSFVDPNAVSFSARFYRFETQ